MPNCQQYRDAVNRIRQERDELAQVCQSMTEPRERKECLSELGQVNARLRRAEEALRNCEAGLPSPGVEVAQGRVTFLRVHDVGTGWGPPNDSLDVEVIFMLDTQPDRAFGFQLRNDNARPAREGMLALLSDAFVNDINVTVDYTQVLNRRNSVAFRIALLK